MPPAPPPNRPEGRPSTTPATMPRGIPSTTFSEPFRRSPGESATNLDVIGLSRLCGRSWGGIPSGIPAEARPGDPLSGARCPWCGGLPSSVGVWFITFCTFGEGFGMGGRVVEGGGLENRLTPLLQRGQSISIPSNIPTPLRPPHLLERYLPASPAPVVASVLIARLPIPGNHETTPGDRRRWGIGRVACSAEGMWPERTRKPGRRPYRRGVSAESPLVSVESPLVSVPH